MTHDPVEHEAKRLALQDLYGADVPDSTVDRVIMRDAEDPVVLSVN